MVDDFILFLEYLKILEKELYKWGIRFVDDYEVVVFMLDIYFIVLMFIDFNVFEILVNCFLDIVNIYYYKWFSIIV